MSSWRRTSRARTWGTSVYIVVAPRDVVGIRGIVRPVLDGRSASSARSFGLRDRPAQPQHDEAVIGQEFVAIGAPAPADGPSPSLPCALSALKSNRPAATTLPCLERVKYREEHLVETRR